MRFVVAAAKRVAAALLVVAALAAGVILGSTRPAVACSCVGITDTQALAQADAVFLGNVVGVDSPDARELGSSSDAVTWTFAVEGVFKGDVGAMQEVMSVLSPGSCGLSLDENRRYLVFTTPESGFPFWPDPAPGQLSAHLCGGTRPAASAEAPPGFPEMRRIDVAAPDPVERRADDSAAGGRSPLVVTLVVLGVAAAALALLTLRRATRSK